jgi:hypothetical protein
MEATMKKQSPVRKPAAEITYWDPANPAGEHFQRFLLEDKDASMCLDVALGFQNLGMVVLEVYSYRRDDHGTYVDAGDPWFTEWKYGWQSSTCQFTLVRRQEEET